MYCRYIYIIFKSVVDGARVFLWMPIVFNNFKEICGKYVISLQYIIPLKRRRAWGREKLRYRNNSATLINSSCYVAGKKYYVFQGNFLEPGYPKPLSHLGLPVSLPKIDAAMIWSHNSKTYLFSGKNYSLLYYYYYCYNIPLLYWSKNKKKELCGSWLMR